MKNQNFLKMFKKLDFVLSGRKISLKKFFFDKAKGKNLIFLKKDKKEIFDLNFDASIKIIEAALNPEISAVEKNKLKDNIKKIIKVPGRMEQKSVPKKLLLLTIHITQILIRFLLHSKKFLNLISKRKSVSWVKWESLEKIPLNFMIR